MALGGSLAGMARVVLRADTAQFNREIDASERRFVRSTGNMSHELNRFSRGVLSGSGAMAGFSRSIAFASTTFLGGAGLTFAIKSSITAASDLNEQINKASVVFRGSQRDILAWSKTTANALGVSQREALATASTFGNMLVPMGFARRRSEELSKSLVNLAADLASFNNADPSDVLEALRSGLAGEIEPLRRYGVFLSQARVQQELLSAGVKVNAQTITAAQKAWATYRIIIRDTSDAQGDFHRTSQGLANQQRILRAQINNLEAGIGKALLPTVLNITQKMTAWLGKSENQVRVQNDLQTVVEGTTKVVTTFAGAIHSVAHAFDVVDDSIKGVRGSLHGINTTLNAALDKLHLGFLKEPEPAAPPSTGAVAAVTSGGLQLPMGIRPTHETANLPGFPAVDIMAKPGTPIRAPESGLITRISGHEPTEPPPLGQGGPWGLSIYFIGTESGNTYYMTHLVKVAPPGRYKKGDVIGIIGDYPGSPADHVHFAIHMGAAAEAHVGSGLFNPADYLARPGTTTTPTTTATAAAGAPPPSGPAAPKKPKALPLIPANLQLALTQAELTKGTRDDLEALRSIEDYLEKRAASEKNINKRIELLQELKTTRDRIADLSKKKDAGISPAARAAGREAMMPGLGGVLTTFENLARGLRTEQVRGIPGGILVPFKPRIDDWKQVRAKLIAKLRAALQRKAAVTKALKRAARARNRDKALIQNHQRALQVLTTTVATLRTDIADATRAIQELVDAANEAAQQAAEEAENVSGVTDNERDYLDLPTDIEEAGVLAEGTAGTADDIAALRRQEEFYSNLVRFGKQVEQDVPTQDVRARTGFFTSAYGAPSVISTAPSTSYAMSTALVNVPLTDDERIEAERNLNQIRSSIQAFYDEAERLRQQAADDAQRAAEEATRAAEQAAADAARAAEDAARAAQQAADDYERNLLTLPAALRLRAAQAAGTAETTDDLTIAQEMRALIAGRLTMTQNLETQIDLQDQLNSLDDRISSLKAQQVDSAKDSVEALEEARRIDAQLVAYLSAQRELVRGYESNILRRGMSGANIVVQNYWNNTNADPHLFSANLDFELKALVA